MSTRKVGILHVGKKVPPGYVELPGAMHLGRGIWLMRLELATRPQDQRDADGTTPDSGANAGGGHE